MAFIGSDLQTMKEAVARGSIGVFAYTRGKRDVDLGVSLYELMPDGNYFQLSYCVGRASFAKDIAKRQLLTPGKLETVPFTNTRLVSKRLSKGSRLVAYINVNKNPFSELNYGTGKDVSSETIADANEKLIIKWSNRSQLRIPILTGSQEKIK